MQWNDTSNFSKSDQTRTPNAWTAYAGKLRLVVYRHINHPKDAWVFSCAPFFEQKVLTAKDIQVAKTQAVRLLQAEITAITAAMAS